MKTFKSLLCVLFLAVLSSAAFAQYNSLPDGLTENSSLKEILAWLDKTSFSKARIGVELDGFELDTQTVPTSATKYSEEAIFAAGFKLAESSGCNLVLRNEDIELVQFASKYPDTRLGSLLEFRKEGLERQFSGDLMISLERLSKKAKAPYQHTKKAEKADLLGLWRTEFKGADKIEINELGRWRVPSQSIRILKDFELKIKEARAEGDGEYMDADKVTFTFADKETSEKFYAAFRQAVKLCRQD